MKRVSIDIETISECDLKKCGTHVYALHPSTKVLCLAYAIDDAPAKVWRVIKGEPMPGDLEFALVHTDCEIHAWNAGGFEMLVLPLACPDWPVIPVDRWRCTMIRAAYWGLPMKLESTALALNSHFQKDMAGHRLMLSMSKPKKDGTFWHEQDPARYDKLCDYCAQDVETEREIANNLPELPHAELKLWRIDFAMMLRGMPVDMDAIRALKDVAEMELTRLNHAMSQVSFGNVKTVNSVKALLDYCHKRMNGMGIPLPVAEKMLPSTSREDVNAFLSNLKEHAPFIVHQETGLAISADVEAMLRIRLEAAKSSVAKLQAMENFATPDATLCGLTQFYGASRTGRFAGRGPQVQNYPRGDKRVNPKEAIDDIKSRRQFYVPPKGVTALEVVSSCLRGCFKPKSGVFIVGDFSQIEARVVAWLAGQDDILEVFARGEDIYTFTANKLGSKDRQFGKVLVLACGFGMGHGKFKDTAKTYGLDLTEDQAKDAVTKWRGANQNIVNFWYALEKAVKNVLDGKGARVQTVGRIKVGMGVKSLAGCLVLGLPSGRHLVYRNARLVPDGARETILYDGVNQTTRKWEAVKTYGGKLVENCVQAVAACLLRHVLEELENFKVLTPLVTIHDEVVCVPNVHGYTEDFYVNALKSTMEHAPKWADGLPVGADVKAMERYAK